MLSELEYSKWEKGLPNKKSYNWTYANYIATVVSCSSSSRYWSPKTPCYEPVLHGTVQTLPESEGIFLILDGFQTHNLNLFQEEGDNCKGVISLLNSQRQSSKILSAIWKSCKTRIDLSDSYSLSKSHHRLFTRVINVLVLSLGLKSGLERSRLSISSRILQASDHLPNIS